MATLLTAPEREDLRMATLAYLATCNTAAFTSGQLAPILRRRRAVGFPFTDGDMDGALAFLEGQGWTRGIDSGFGGSRAYQVTSPGVLEAERRGFC